MKQCIAINRCTMDDSKYVAGERCPDEARPGSAFCWVHRLAHWDGDGGPLETVNELAPAQAEAVTA